MRNKIPNYRDLRAKLEANIRETISKINVSFAYFNYDV